MKYLRVVFFFFTAFWLVLLAQTACPDTMLLAGYGATHARG